VLFRSASFATSASSAVSASFAPNIYNSDGTVSSTRNVTIPTSINLQFDSTAAGSTFTVKSAPDADVLISNLPTGTSSSLLAYNTATGKVVAMATSSIQNVVSSSFATSASFAISASRAVSASFATSASYALSASFAVSSSRAISASFATSASYALSASFAVSSSRAISASIATTASYVLQAVSASFASTASSIGNAITNNVNDYILTATGGGSINGEANLRFNGTTLTVTGNEVITGNLTVQGTASFQQTTNLEVADRFILLASGSNTTGDGGLVIQQATQNVGELFGYDSAVNRWAFTSSFTASQPSFTPAAFITTTEVGTIDPPAAPIYGGASNGSGNIYVNTSTGDVFIYS
jgi:hypothetical protein